MTIKTKLLLITSYFAIICLSYFSKFPFACLIKGMPAINSLNISFALFNHLLLLFFVLISASGWGKIFWQNTLISPLERFVFSTGFGLGVLSLTVLFLNFAGITGRMVYTLILLFGIILFMTIEKKLRGKLSRNIKLALLISLIPVLSSLISALAPPTQFDSLVYHLALPSSYLKNGGIYLVPSNIFFSFPQNIEMLYQMALAIDNDILANLIHWSFLPLNAVVIYVFSRRFYSERIALFSSLLWIFTPIILFLSSGTFIDLGLTYYLLLSFYACIIWSDTSKKEWIIYSGIFMGFALGAKYTAFSSLFIMFVVIFISSRNIRYSVLFGAIALSVFSPWLIKNIYYLHNPIAPWGIEIFSGTLIDPDVVANYFSHIKEHGVVIKNLADLLIIPWKVTVEGYNFGGGFDIIGPLFIMLVPSLFFLGKIDRITKYILIYILIFCTIWVSTGKVLRFLVPAVPFLCIISSVGLSSLFEKGNTVFRAFVTAVLLLCLAHNVLIFHWVMACIDPYAPVLSSEDRHSYLSRKINSYKAVRNSINRLRSSSKVLFLGEVRSFYSQADSLVPTVFDKNPVVELSNRMDSYNEVMSSLKAGGFTHILINEYEFKRLNYDLLFSDKGRRIFKELLSNIDLEYSDSFNKVYKL